MPTQVKTPAGRIVWGHPTRAVPKVNDHGQPVIDPKTGLQINEYVFGLALNRVEFEQTIWPAMYQEALTGFPNGQFPADFAWKYKDGDTAVKQDGTPYSAQDYNVGKIILAIKTQMCPSVFKWGGSGWDQVEATGLKCGDWVSVPLNLKVNVSTNPRYKSSLYVNPEMIELVGYDTEIIGAASPDQLLGAGPTAAPAGVSTTPISSAPPVGAPVPQPAAPVPAQQYAPQPVAPAPAQQYAPQPVAPAPAQQYAPQPVAPQPVAPQPAPVAQPAALPPPAQSFTAPQPAAPAPAPVAQPMPAPVAAPVPHAPAAPQPGAAPGMMPPR